MGIVIGRRKAQEGMILVATIWILAALVLIVGGIAHWVSGGMDIAWRQNQRADAVSAFESTKSVYLYLALTRGFSPGGIKVPEMAQQTTAVAGVSLDDFLAGAQVDDMGGRSVAVEGNEIRVDARVYRGCGDSLIAVQDMAGLIQLNSKSDVDLEGLLHNLGVDDSRVRSSVAALNDYIDANDVHEANGAEATHYRRAGLPLPPNKPLLSRFELARVMRWNETLVNLDEGRLFPLLVADSLVPYNVNAMPGSVARVVLGLTQTELDSFIGERDRAAYTSVKEMSQRLKRPVARFDQLAAMPSPKMRISQWLPQARLQREIDVELSQTTGRGAPWLVIRDVTIKLNEIDSLAEPNTSSAQTFCESVYPDINGSSAT